MAAEASEAGGGAARRRLLVHGIVQGVGFRPFVYGLAVRLGLAGFVLNDAEGVVVEVEGPADALAAFERALVGEAPPLARIDEVLAGDAAPRGESGFTIAASAAGAARATLISPDTAVCEDCLRELFDPADRRHGYPFINCTNCGPRFTIVADVPYDREKTTMRAFPMCPSCRAEYENPLDRRFHAQPNACPACGPHLSLRDARGAEIVGGGRDREALAEAARMLAGGAILSVKGLGGYHLACDALDPQAVARLRARKRREAKPFALMVADLAEARRICRVSEPEAALLASRRRPIVLLDRLPEADLPEALAPGVRTLGVMLPYTPLHHLLMRAFAAALPPDRLPVLVMTSGNLSDEPIAYEDGDALERLAPIADAALTHDRGILTRCDDSVTRFVAGGEQLARRSRGHAPEPLTIEAGFPAHTLAYGGHLKNTFCMARGHEAFVSHHIGDLENLETLRSQREGILHYARLFDISPEVVAYDLHPEYLATKEALASPVARRVGVQHHHAHIASVLAEHGLAGPAIGVAADGTGYGLDGAIWGCEVLLADLAGFTRLAHLAYAPLPGGDQAVRQVWRVAAAYLQQAYGSAGEDFLALDIPFVRGLDRERWRVLARMIERGLNSPPASSLGRLFDAAAALAGVRQEALFEGQAAIELEAIAAPGAEPYPFAAAPQAGGPLLLDARPAVRAIVEDIRAGAGAPHIASRFHAGVAAMLAAACRAAREETGVGLVALSGGVFQNRLLLETLAAALAADGFHVVTNRRVPPNDGGLSLGQAAVAAERVRRGLA